MRIQEKHLLALLTRENAFTAKQSLLSDIKMHAESVRKEVMYSNVLSTDNFNVSLKNSGVKQKLSKVFKSVALFLKKQQLYDKLEKWRENHNKEMMEIVEKCHEIEQASREAFNAMIDEKKQKGTLFLLSE